MTATGERRLLNRRPEDSFAAHQRPAEGDRLSPGPTGPSVVAGNARILGRGAVAPLSEQQVKLGLPPIGLRAGDAGWRWRLTRLLGPLRAADIVSKKLPFLL